jgi:Flp pilus assembly protein TadG
MVEFAFILTALLLLTAGLADGGRAFYQYNAVSAAARYAARWASVQGGTCEGSPSPSGQSDWCNQFAGAGTTDFWSQTGNVPLQGANVACPTDIDSTFTAYYSDSNSVAASRVTPYLGTPTIVGSILQRLDTNSSSSNVVKGLVTPGINSSNLLVCIQTTGDPSIFNASGTSSGTAGSRVAVYVYYPFTLISNQFTTQRFNLVASAKYGVE